MTVPCTLRSAKRGRELDGQVVAAGTLEAVAGAHVTVWRADDIAHLADPSYFGPFLDSSTTDEGGSFDVVVPRETAVGLVIRHAGYANGRTIIVPTTTDRLRVLLEPATQVTVCRRALVPEPASPGRCRCVLLDRAADRVVAWDGDPPIHVQPVPPGSYNVFLASADGSYGQATVTVRQNQPAVVTVDTIPGSWFEGRVVFARGQPAADVTVRLLQGNWPDEIVDWLGTTATDGEGRFRVFGGAAVAAKVQVLVDGKPVETVPVALGAPARVVLARRP
jgi:hypothetical protein